jgi:DsrE/DsrF-like family
VNVLVIVNDQPYGSERPYNALRLANGLSKRDTVEVRVFLLGDERMHALKRKAGAVASPGRDPRLCSRAPTEPGGRLSLRAPPVRSPPA